MGPAERRDEERSSQAPGRHQVPGRMDDARRVPRISRARGISPNVASFVGATTVRIHELGYDDRAPTPEELDAHASPRRARRWRTGALGSRLVAHLRARLLRQDRRAHRARAGRVRIRRRCTSPTCGAKETASSRRWTSSSTIAREANIRRGDLSPQGRPGNRTGPRWTRSSQKVEAAREAKGSRSPPTCTPTPPAPRASTPPCRPGCRKAGTTGGPSACATRRSARRSSRRCDAHRRLGEPAPGRRRRRNALSSASRTTR